ncbi:MAG: DUF1800 domain-containing protein [Cytophagales bacterium]|nr:DUF1800 domain-containing protein [Cytophagales bacterium]
MKNFISFVCLILVGHLCLGQTVETLGQGNVKNISVTASSNSSNGIRTLLRDGYLPNHNAASRFLSQATLGPKFAEIEEVTNQGIEAWLNSQLALPNSFSIENYIRSISQSIADSLNRTPQTTPYTVQNLNLSDWYFDVAWFQGSMTSPDRLRWRVALALSEIFVTSRNSDFDGNPYALASYYDVLLDHSFGNYRDLLESITYHPTMAVYLTFMNNHAQATVNGNLIFPDENYAREIMQLFSIGLYELNNDGTEKKDVNGNSIPTYNNNDIAELAKVFTGFSWHNAEYLGDRNENELDYTYPLKFFPIDSSDAIRRPWKSNPDITNGHQPGGKTFLGTTIGQGRTAEQGELDVQDALNVIFNHPNVGPFISRRLIQRLVTSNPSAAYINRVATIFNNNGNGVRGDLKAVVKGILLDPDARECCKGDEPYKGKLKEPFIRYMNLVNGLNLTSTTGVFRNRMNEVYDKMEQRPMESPTVFNFFQPDYIPDGDLKKAGKYAPEFQLLNSITLTGYLNALDEWLIDNDPIDYSSYFSGETVKDAQEPEFDFTADYLLAGNKNLPQLLDKYNMILAHGGISETNFNHIKKAIESMPDIYDADGDFNETNAERRIRLTIFLMMATPDYLINR